jgi:hypothetical protein
MKKYKRIFLSLSSELTGYSTLELEGTGLADQYFSIVCKDIGGDVPKTLFSTATEVLELDGYARAKAMHDKIISSDLLWPICQSIVFLWYQGVWNRMTPAWYQAIELDAPPSSPIKKVAPGGSFVPSAAAYTEQLSYKAAGAHPPGAHPTGFGSWGLLPVFGDFTNQKTEA